MAPPRRRRPPGSAVTPPPRRPSHRSPPRSTVVHPSPTSRRQPVRTQQPFVPPPPVRSRGRHRRPAPDRTTRRTTRAIEWRGFGVKLFSGLRGGARVRGGLFPALSTIAVADGAHQDDVGLVVASAALAASAAHAVPHDGPTRSSRRIARCSRRCSVACALAPRPAAPTSWRWPLVAAVAVVLAIRRDSASSRCRMARWVRDAPSVDRREPPDRAVRLSTRPERRARLGGVPAWLGDPHDRVGGADDALPVGLGVQVSRRLPAAARDGHLPAVPDRARGRAVGRESRAVGEIAALLVQAVAAAVVRCSRAIAAVPSDGANMGCS